MSGAARAVAAIDWTAWRPTERATLLFAIRDGEVLLIRKKTGLGAGKINGPGGRIEPGESDEAGAIREVQEELRVTPTGVRWAGELFFQFTDGYALHGVVFTAAGVEGDPTETREAAPLWRRIDAMPWDEMWADDRLWFPLMLAGRRFRGWFVFEGDAMLDARVVPVD